MSSLSRASDDFDFFFVFVPCALTIVRGTVVSTFVIRDP